MKKRRTMKTKDKNVISREPLCRMEEAQQGFNENARHKCSVDTDTGKAVLDALFSLFLHSESLSQMCFGRSLSSACLFNNILVLRIRGLTVIRQNLKGTY